MDLLHVISVMKRTLVAMILTWALPSLSYAEAPCDLLFSLGLFDRAEAQCELEAQQGNSTAALHLASIYTAAQQPSRAIVWLQKASDGGNVKAQYNLGYAYQHGVGLPKNRDEAKKHYSLAADGKHYDAGLLHAQMLLEEGQHNPAINRLESMLPLYDGSKQQADIHYLLGIAFMPTNTDQAVDNFHASADGGTRHGYSAYNLAKLYLSGDSVSFDQDKGMYYAKMAEEAGVGEARNLMPNAPVHSSERFANTPKPSTPEPEVTQESITGTENFSDIQPTAAGSSPTESDIYNNAESHGTLSDEILAELAMAEESELMPEAPPEEQPAPLPAPKPMAKKVQPTQVAVQKPMANKPTHVKTTKPKPPVAKKATPHITAQPARRAESHLLPDRTDNKHAGGVHNFERFQRERYTLQVGIFKTTDAAKNFVHQHGLSPAYIHPSRYKGNEAFILLVGNFDGQGQALQATSNLPAAVAARGSIARSFRRIRELWPAP